MTAITTDSFESLNTVNIKTTLFILFAVLIANIGLYVFKRFCSRASKNNNTLAGIFFGAAGVLYSLILAFVIMAEWDSFNELEMTIASEGDKLNSILAHSNRLPDTIKSTIACAIDGYCRQAINNEWAMQDDKAANQPSAIPDLRYLLLTTMPANTIEENIFKVMDEDLSNISDLHRTRLNHTYSQLPSLVWGMLQAGAVLLVIFCYFFQVSSLKIQQVYISFFVCLLAMCLSIVYNLDHPFSPGSGLDNSTYKKVLSELPYYYTSANKIAYLSYCNGK